MLFPVPGLDEQESKILERIVHLKKELDFVVSPAVWRGSLRRDAMARAIRGSNSIEGYEVSLDDARAVVDGEQPREASEENKLVTAGYRSAMTLVLQKENDPYFSHAYQFLDALHFMMVSHDMTKHPGRWRPGPVFVHDETKEVQVYEAPAIELVPSLMVELVSSLNSAKALHPVIAAAMAHLNFVMIHPYSDGNGRMARCLQTLVLARGAMGRNPIFVSIEEYLGANTQEYYDVLSEVGGGSWHPERDARKWIRFCLKAHYRQAKTMKHRADLWSNIFTLVEEEAKRRGVHERSVIALSEAAFGFEIRNAAYRNSAEVSEALASRDLKELVEQGLLTAHGEKRGRYYTRGPQIVAMLQRFTKPPKPGDPFVEVLANGQKPLFG